MSPESWTRELQGGPRKAWIDFFSSCWGYSLINTLKLKNLQRYFFVINRRSIPFVSVPRLCSALGHDIWRLDKREPTAVLSQSRRSSLTRWFLHPIPGQKIRASPGWTRPMLRSQTRKEPWKTWTFCYVRNLTGPIEILKKNLCTRNLNLPEERQPIMSSRDW